MYTFQTNLCGVNVACTPANLGTKGSQGFYQNLNYYKYEIALIHLIVKNVFTYKTRKLATNYLSTILGDFISSSHLNAELYKSSSKGLHCIEKYNFLKKLSSNYYQLLDLKKIENHLASK